MFVLLLCFALLCPWALPREPQRWGVVCVRLLCVGSSDAPSLLLPRKPKLKSEECYCPCRGDEKGCGCAHLPFSTLFFLLFHDYSLQTITAALSTLGRSCACLQESCASGCVHQAESPGCSSGPGLGSAQGHTAPSALFGAL